MSESWANLMRDLCLRPCCDDRTQRSSLPLTRRWNVKSCQVIMWPSPCAGLSQPKVNMQLNCVKTRRPTPFTGVSDSSVGCFLGPSRKESHLWNHNPLLASRDFGTVSRLGVPLCSLFGRPAVWPDLPAVCSSELPPAVYGRWRNTIQLWRGNEQSWCVKHAQRRQDVLYKQQDPP